VGVLFADVQKPVAVPRQMDLAHCANGSMKQALFWMVLPNTAPARNLRLD
jgi:hypothetical protein